LNFDFSRQEISIPATPKIMAMKYIALVFKFLNDFGG
jgi:hypothetical protein